MSESQFEKIAEAIKRLTEDAGRQPCLEDVAQDLDLSPFHFQRTFHRMVGISPKRYVQSLTILNAKSLLHQQRSVLTTSLEVGLSGPSRLHDLFVTYEGVSPGDVKLRGKGLKIGWGIHNTPLGPTLVATTHRGVCHLSFLDGREGDSLQELKSQWPEAELLHQESSTQPIIEEVNRRLRGNQPRPLSLLLKGSPLQLKVWQALMAMDEGQLTSYQRLAEHINLPKGPRAVGNAIGANPIALLIPCHRVIRTNGELGGYRWGLSRKKALIGLEQGRS